MNILFFEEGKPNHDGGFGGSIFSLLQNVEALKKFNINFSIVSLYEIPILKKLIKDNDINYYYKIPFSNLKIKNKKPKNGNIRFNFKGGLISDISSYKNINRIFYYNKIIKKTKPDLCWGNNGINFNFSPFLISKINSIKYIQHQRANQLFFSFNFILMLIFCDNIISISNHVKKTILNKVKFKLLTKKISVIYNFENQFLNKKIFNKTSLRKINFIFLGRLIPKKNIEEVINIATLIKQKKLKYPFEFNIYGSFNCEDYKKRIIEIIKEKKLNSIINFNGYTSKELIFCSKSYNFLLHTTKYEDPEPFGRVLLEANLFGAIPITNGFGGAGEVIENKKNGYVYSEIGDIYKIIIKFIKDETLYFQKLNEFYKFSNKYSGEIQTNQIKKILKLYDK